MIINRASKKIPAEYGIADYYKYYCKNNNYKITKKQHNEIISLLNKFIVDEIVETGKEFPLPKRTGYISMTKIKRGLKMLPGEKVINTSPPNWKATLDLWKKDEEAKEKKILIRHTNIHTGGYVYLIKYTKYNATFKNKSIIEFAPVRDFKRAVTKRINDYSKEKYNANETKI